MCSSAAGLVTGFDNSGFAVASQQAYDSENMSVLVHIGNRKAILRRGEWMCADTQLESLLNTTTKTWIQETGGPPIQDRDHERTVAREITRRLGGRIALRIPSSPKRSAQIYISHRQLELDFS
jgi:hypothetical protein